jgi:lipoprotein-anchoring transpeptidase ErfK/SrfK
VPRLGRPASHGCVRLHPSHAAQLFALVRSEGRTRIVVSNSALFADRR